MLQRIEPFAGAALVLVGAEELGRVGGLTSWLIVVVGVSMLGAWAFRRWTAGKAAGRAQVAATALTLAAAAIAAYMLR